MSNIVLVENVQDEKCCTIKIPKIDGECSGLLRKYISNENGDEVANNILKNSYNSIHYFADPFLQIDKKNTSKILALGKVQSGKTAYFLGCISYAFDNGYDLVFLIAGTKNKLKDQNLERVEEYFANNKKIFVCDINKITDCEIISKINSGLKVIVVTLKNPAINKNLGKVEYFVINNKSIPILLVDDEGDEYTPGAPKLQKKNNRIGATHDVISSIINTADVCTFLSVTATPQANFLISTIDDISPDYCVLVQPGDNYTGGNSYHDSRMNPHVVDIIDTDTFKTCIPESFMNALRFYLFAICLKRSQKDYSSYSMLIHPSFATKIQNDVTDKINDRLVSLVRTLSDPRDIAYKDEVEQIYKQLVEYRKNIEDETFFIDIKKIEEEIPFVIKELKTYVFNVSKNGITDILRDKNDDTLYKIYIGGNMIGRGLTIKNLIVTYMYRDSKEQAVDTLYQRARWLGYKKSYFDVCRVYMTDSLKSKFIAIVDSENDMRDSLTKFLDLKNDIKKFPRIFSLNYEDGKLILTRKSVSKTVTYSRVNAGFVYDRSVWFARNDKIKNKSLIKSFCEKYKTSSYEKCFSTNEYQTHLIFDINFNDFFNDFLIKYRYPRGSKFSLENMKLMKDELNLSRGSEMVSVLIMRYKTKEYRSLASSGGNFIKELVQNENEGTAYPGDKNLPDYKSKLCIQIHLVYTGKDSEDYMPLLCVNNPFTKETIRYVTGDNDYDSI